jgi:aspartate oxidase
MRPWLADDFPADQATADRHAHHYADTVLAGHALCAPERMSIASVAARSAWREPWKRG